MQLYNTKTLFFQKKIKNQLIAVDDRLKYEKVKIQIYLKSKVKYIHKIVKKLSRQVR